MMKGKMCPTAKKAGCPAGGKKMSHSDKVRKCMKANPGMSLPAASKMVAAMKK